MKEARMSRSGRERKAQLSPDAERLLASALGLANSGSRLEDTYWQQLLVKRIEHLLDTNHPQAIYDALDRTHLTDLEAYGALIEMVEHCAETVVVEYEVEHVRTDAVEQRGVQDVEPLASSEHRGLRGARHRREGGDRDVHGLVTGASDRAAEPVHEGARRVVAGRPWNVRGLGGGDEAGEGAGDFGGLRGVAHRGLQGRFRPARPERRAGRGAQKSRDSTEPRLRGESPPPRPGAGGLRANRRDPRAAPLQAAALAFAWSGNWDTDIVPSGTPSSTDSPGGKFSSILLPTGSTANSW